MIVSKQAKFNGHKGLYQPLIYAQRKEKKKANNTNTIITTP